MTDLLTLLPPVPEPGWGDGYDWISALGPTPWREVAGTEDWLYGDWPYVVVAYYNGSDLTPAVYGLAVYTEGDVQVAAFGSSTQRRDYVRQNFAHYDG